MDKVCKKCDVRMKGCEGCVYPYYHRLSGRAMTVCLVVVAIMMVYFHHTGELGSILSSM